MSKRAQCIAIKLAHPQLSSYAVADLVGMDPADVRKAWRRAGDPRLRIRPPVSRLTEIDVLRAIEMRRAGYSSPAIGRELGISADYARDIVRGRHPRTLRHSAA